ncbi:MAG TPA: hypothetical protein VJ890_19980 [Vineibacter sp.]|nr:hypothetical protein [Vineibacter sp.]
MAILTIGMPCSLCGERIEERDPVAMFPAFISNELDPCYQFSDGAFHEACFRAHAHAADMLRLVETLFSKSGPGKRQCAVCRNEILHYTEYVSTEYLSGRDGDPLHTFNYFHFHRACLANWESRQRFIDVARAAIASGSWKGPSLAWLIDQMEAHQHQ